MKKIVVNDTNVFIDLHEVGLLDKFFLLPWEIHTTDFVMYELLREGQKDAVSRFEQDGLLHIATFDIKEIQAINKLFKQFDARTNVSITDCSVWYYARENNFTLLTGDRKLRKSAVGDGVEVRGIIYVFDELVESCIISPQIASEKLVMLRDINPRLPKDEIEKRLKHWGGEHEEKGGCL